MKLIFNYYKTTRNKVALTFDQILMNRLTSKLNPTDAIVECHPDISRSDSLKRVAQEEGGGRGTVHELHNWDLRVFLADHLLQTWS